MRSLAAANAAMLFVASGMFAMFFFASLYAQQVLGFDPLEAGLAFLPITAGIMLGAGLAQQGVRRSACGRCRSPASASRPRAWRC